MLIYFIMTLAELIQITQHLTLRPSDPTVHCKILPKSLIAHYGDVMMSTIASQITSLAIVFSTVYSDQRKHQSSASLAFVWELTGEFPAQTASYAQNVSIWWRHHEFLLLKRYNSSILNAGILCISTHWGQDKMAAKFLTTISNIFSWMKKYRFRLRFHWTLFPGVQLTRF